jgi:hypothetical protein
MTKDAYQIWLAAIRKKLAAAAVEAEPLLAQDRFDEAEAIMRRADGDIHGALALGDLYTRALAECMQHPEPNRVRAVRLYEKALRWRSAWPEVHTESEAEAQSAHYNEVKQELKALLYG